MEQKLEDRTLPSLLLHFEKKKQKSTKHCFKKVAGNYPARVVSHIQLHLGITPYRWQETYDSALINMKPGLNELVLHLAYRDEEMKAVTMNKTHWWDAAWSQRDYDYIISQHFKNVLSKNNIQVVT